MAYQDFREHLAKLEAAGKLVRIKEEFCKDTEIHPLVRWQFRGLPEEERKAFIFENVKDAKGNKYNTPVVVGALAASKDIFCMSMECEPGQSMHKISEGLRNPIKPILVEEKDAPCQEEVHIGENLLEHGGTGEFPIPISTPGFDCAPYTTYSHWVTKDPETGVYNIGNYRGQIKAPDRTGVYVHPTQHLAMHWEKCRKMGIPLEAALVIGVTPNVTFAANTKVPYEADEYDVAGGIAGEAVKVVKCKTIDLVVPATAEVVFEGKISTEFMEPEAPFGETSGFMSQKVNNGVFEITGITHRKNPVWASIISQFPPSESTKLRQMSFEPTFFKYLKYDCNIPTVLDVSFHESSSSYFYCVIQMKKSNPAQPWQALNAACAFDTGIGKVFIVVDEDIDPRDPDFVNWAISTRCLPERDVQTRTGRLAVLEYSAVPPHKEGMGADTVYPGPNGSSALVIDATRKWDYPPVALPKKEFMENAKKRWEELGLPTLNPKSPWHGYDLGYWTEEDEEKAQLAVRGDHYVTGERNKQNRVKVDDTYKLSN
ncbi:MULTISPECIES: UbiD family decarboxylase [unclassified Paenibacillus]|uniref:UbiD family decarboxylase n=1 Tax=unclassified Paenibacillus TaxID=185978 RepID=UPI001AE60997|nr:MULTISPECIES: UbiD family decarboxylase [unclassified Paenibacillus]MBP1157183.1 4-hydroxy-3-polyprenylbenzoate decarboxylase [Paenibacillus sp. PvP091]MBP1172078.1 4-hydroxy-3-polyprenylbenzoate decarboxylase [Paenibacillus sp. PvR098]MBP2438459.1 4-hydroxy-3-polyprenylbenzoate decarboxylase [Paenibacillus sp. PvP052]